jgi:protein phosphatase PTC7
MSSSSKYVQDSLKMSPIQNFKEDIRVTEDFQVAAWVIPHSDKEDTGGEDTYFISENGNQFGVFDGVGGWAELGVNARDFSYRLMSNCKKVADAGVLTNPLEILKEGFNLTNKQHIQGSCTACVGVIRKENSNLFLDAINLGDSGLMVLSQKVPEARHSIEAPTFEVKLKSAEQVHRFNFPFQLGSEGNSDKPERGDKYSTELNYGDVVIFGSDGLWDNVYEKDVVQLLNAKGASSATEIAETLAQETFKFSLSKTRTSPFMKEAKKFKMPYAAPSGKTDDITVLVLKVQKKSKM